MTRNMGVGTSVGLGAAAAALLLLGPDSASNWEIVPLAVAVAGLILLLVAVWAWRSRSDPAPVMAAGLEPEARAVRSVEAQSAKNPLVGRAGAIMPPPPSIVPVAAQPADRRAPVARDGLSIPLAVVGGGVLALAALRRLAR